MTNESPLPNLNHPINQGKILWNIINPAYLKGRYLAGLVNNSNVKLLEASASPKISGFTRPGGSASLTYTNGTSLSWDLNPLFSNLPSGKMGFSGAVWIYSITAGIRYFTKGPSTIWYMQNSGTNFELSVPYSTTNGIWDSTVASGTGKWQRVLWTFRDNGSGTAQSVKLYVNGFNKAITTTQTPSGTVVVDSMANALKCNVSGVCYLDDWCLWNRILNPQEAWVDFLESSSGYPGGLLKPLKTLYATPATALKLFKQFDMNGLGAGGGFFSNPVG